MGFGRLRGEGAFCYTWLVGRLDTGYVYVEIRVRKFRTLAKVSCNSTVTKMCERLEMRETRVSDTLPCRTMTAVERLPVFRIVIPLYVLDALCGLDGFLWRRGLGGCKEWGGLIGSVVCLGSLWICVGFVWEKKLRVRRIKACIGTLLYGMLILLAQSPVNYLIQKTKLRICWIA